MRSQGIATAKGRDKESPHKKEAKHDVGTKVSKGSSYLDRGVGRDGAAGDDGGEASGRTPIRFVLMSSDADPQGEAERESQKALLSSKGGVGGAKWQ
jgi:hypothetical protein